MSNYQDLEAQANELLRQAKELRDAERGNALIEVKAMVAEWNFTADELGFKAKSEKRAKLPAKYKNPLTGETWCGRGAMPKWMSGYISNGASKSDYLIA